MKLYKIHNNEILHELYGAKLTDLKGYEAISEEDANKLYKKSFDEKLDRIKTEHDKIEAEHSEEIIQLNNTIKELSNKTEITDEELDSLNNLNKTLKAKRSEVQKKKTTAHDTIMNELTKEQKFVNDYIAEQVKKSKQLRDKTEKTQREQTERIQENKKTFIQENILARERAVEKVNLSDMSSEKKVIETKKYTQEIEYYKRLLTKI